MEFIEFFKKQSKLFFKEWENKTCENFNIKGFFDYYKVPIERQMSFTLMNAQHIISQIAGFKKWNDLIIASRDDLEFAKVRFNYCSKGIKKIKKWDTFFSDEKIKSLDIKKKIEIAKKHFSEIKRKKNDNIYFFPPFDLDMDQGYCSEYDL